MIDRSTRDYKLKKMTAMERERESFISHYRELAEFIQPRRGRFLMQDRNKGDKRYQSIVNSRATVAHRIATSGLFAGTMSPTHPWFGLETPDPGMMRMPKVQEWIFQVTSILRRIFLASNLYEAVPVALGELLLFGTTAMSQVDDFENVARFYPHEPEIVPRGGEHPQRKS